MTFENKTKKKKKQAKSWLSKEKGVVFKELKTRENREHDSVIVRPVLYDIKYS